MIYYCVAPNVSEAEESRNDVYIQPVQSCTQSITVGQNNLTADVTILIYCCCSHLHTGQ